MTSEPTKIYTPAVREGGNITFVPGHMIKAIQAANRERVACNRHKLTHVTFNGAWAIEADTFMALLKLCDWMVTLTAGSKTLGKLTSRYAGEIKSGYFVTQKGDNWTAFLCADTVDQWDPETTAHWTDDRNGILGSRPVDGWVALAQSKDKSGATSLCRYGGNVAADGFRAHYRDDLQPWEEYNHRTNIMGLIEKCKAYTTTITLGKAAAIDLKHACQRAQRMGDDSLTITFGEAEKKITYASEKFNGDVSGRHDHVGDSITIMIKAKYLEQAIGTPGDITFIKLGMNGKKPVLVNCDHRWAVIAPMDPGGEKK